MRRDCSGNLGPCFGDPCLLETLRCSRDIISHLYGICWLSVCSASRFPQPLTPRFSPRSAPFDVHR